MSLPRPDTHTKPTNGTVHSLPGGSQVYLFKGLGGNRSCSGNLDSGEHNRLETINALLGAEESCIAASLRRFTI